MTQSLRRDTFILFSQKKKINNNRTLSKVYVSGIQDVDSNRLMSKPNTHTHTHLERRRIGLLLRSADASWSPVPTIVIPLRETLANLNG